MRMSRQRLSSARLFLLFSSEPCAYSASSRGCRAPAQDISRMCLIPYAHIVCAHTPHAPRELCRPRTPRGRRCCTRPTHTGTRMGTGTRCGSGTGRYGQRQPRSLYRVFPALRSVTACSVLPSLHWTEGSISTTGDVLSITRTLANRVARRDVRRRW